MTRLPLGLIAFLASLCVVAGHPRAEQPSFACTVDRVIDGDTWTCTGMVAHVRGWGFDAPDVRCGRRTHCRQDAAAARAATEFVSKLILGERLQCEGKGFSYDRIVARCALHGRDLGCKVIRAGHAIEAKRYSRGAYQSCSP